VSVDLVRLRNIHTSSVPKGQRTRRAGAGENHPHLCNQIQVLALRNNELEDWLHRRAGHEVSVIRVWLCGT
jgi:hypothetical protein